MNRLLLLYCLFLSLAANAQTNLYVDSSISTSGAGTSWTSAYKTLNEALNTANTASTTVKYIINVAQGTYYPTGLQSGTNRDSTFFIARGGLKLWGGFPNGGGVRNPGIYSTKLSGNINTTANADNSYHVMVIAGIAASADSILVDGFTILKGYAYGISNKTYNTQPVDRAAGGGIANYSVAGKLLISRCIFSDNASSGNGGAMFNTTADMKIDSCSFASDSTLGNGGAICSLNSSVDISNSSFIANRAAIGGGIYNSTTLPAPAIALSVSNSSFTSNTTPGSSVSSDGGGLYDYADNALGAVVTNCIFTNNFASDGGGACFAVSSSTGSSARIKGCNFSANTAVYDGGAASGPLLLVDSSSFINNKAGRNGGGLMALGNSLTVSRNLFSNDSADFGGGLFISTASNIAANTFLSNKANQGGALCDYNSTIAHTIQHNTFSGNLAAKNGGGLFLSSASPKLQNCLLSGNKAGISGGGIYDTLLSSPAITNCTLAGDTAIRGNGIYNASTAAPTVLNTIVWEGPLNSIFNSGSSTITITYSSIQGGFTGPGNISSDPLFVNPLPASSAPAVTGTYSMLLCSPAINTGLNSGPYTGVADLAGNPRLFGTTVDQGAFEIQSGYPAPITGSNSVCINSNLQLSIAVIGGTWTSSNPATASISATGLVTGLAAGTDTITFSNGTALCPNTVTKIIVVNTPPAVAALTGNNSVCAGDTTRLSSTTIGGLWSSSDVTLATVSPTGLVTGVSAGTDTISYSLSNVSGCVTTVFKIITINPKPPVAPISGNSIVCDNDTLMLNDATSGGTWSSSNSGIATVNTTGIVTGVSGGIDTILYTVTNVAGCKSAAVKLVVVSPRPSLSAIGGGNTVCVNSTLPLSNPTLGGSWTSTNTSVATVSSTGVVTGIAAGTDTIVYSVTNASGCSSNVRLAVTVKAIPNISPITGGRFVCMHSSTPLGDPVNGGTWASDNTGVATVTSTGRVFPVALGTAVISYTITGSNGCAAVATKTMTVDSVDVFVGQNGAQLTARLAGAIYQWLDCNKGKTPIPGQTSQSFVAQTGGSYAVVISVNACTDTSKCLNVASAGLSSYAGENPAIHVYPSPATGKVSISAANNIQKILIRDITGRYIRELRVVTAAITFDVSNYPPGIYIIEVYEGNLRYAARMSVVH